MDEMITSLLKAEMIKQVNKGTGNFFFEAFLVPKPRDPTGPPKMVVDYSPLMYGFDRSLFKQTDPFTILSMLKAGCNYHFGVDMKTRYW